ncbi:UNVERIFIED_CONTAM: hypothetical protein RMT77_014295 [Armadillidium vulgare]
MVPSLKNLCRVPGLVEILNHPHIKKEIFNLPISKYNYEERDDALQRVVFEMLKDYNFVIKENIPRHFILFIGFEMTKWAEYLKECFNLSFKFSEHFIKSSFFTSEGLLDEEKAARELLKEQSFNLFLKYKIACQYFLDDIIPGLWQQLKNNEPNFKEWLKENNPECPMVMWSDDLEEINSSSELEQKVKTSHFKERVFSYGLKNKNLSAVKFSYGPEGKSRKTTEEVKIVRSLVDTTFCNFIRRVLKDIKFYKISTDSLLNRELVADRNIIMYFLSLMNEEELKEFFLKFENSSHIVSWFLLWPYQHQFMDFVHIIFENFGADEYEKLMTDIIFLITDRYLSQICNYRLLLREVWIKSPDHLKEQITQSMSNWTPKVIKMLFTLPNFTAQDLEIVNLILKYASFTSRKNILMFHGYKICSHLVVSHSNFELADMFLKSTKLYQDHLHEFKTKLLVRLFPDIMMKQSIDSFEKIFKWAVGSDEIDDFKKEIFQYMSDQNNEDYFFMELEEEVPFCFLNKILKWFLKTDQNIKEWIKNIVFSPTIYYKYPKWIDRLLKYRGYSDEEASDIKREIIFGKLPEIARNFYIYANVMKCSYLSKIYVLSLLKKEEVLEFIDQMRPFYEDSIEQKICLYCSNHNLVHGIGEGQFNYGDHGTRGFATFDEIDRICSSVSQLILNYF